MTNKSNKVEDRETKQKGFPIGNFPKREEVTKRTYEFQTKRKH